MVLKGAATLSFVFAFSGMSAHAQILLSVGLPINPGLYTANPNTFGTTQLCTTSAPQRGAAVDNKHGFIFWAEFSSNGGYNLASCTVTDARAGHPVITRHWLHDSLGLPVNITEMGYDIRHDRLMGTVGASIWVIDPVTGLMTLHVNLDPTLDGGGFDFDDISGKAYISQVNPTPRFLNMAEVDPDTGAFHTVALFDTSQPPNYHPHITGIGARGGNVAFFYRVDNSVDTFVNINIIDGSWMVLGGGSGDDGPASSVSWLAPVKKPFTLNGNGGQIHP